MRTTTRYAALGLAGILLAACGHKDKNAPLAFVPADTPYVVASLESMSGDAQKALFAQTNEQLPAQLAQLESTAARLEDTDPDSARLLRALHSELDGKTVETFAQSAGIDISGRTAIYGLGLAPVMRLELSDPKAFEAFIGRLERAYGKPLDSASEGEQNYRRLGFPASGTEMILATVDKQAVAALLPANAPTPMLREALGLERPQKSLQDDGRLADLAKAKGYRQWVVGQLDLARALPLVFGDKDPLLAAAMKARAETEFAKTGEPVANQLKISPSCATDAARIAARVPGVSFGYTRLDATHQDLRMDIALADDISKAFTNLQVMVPGLGTPGSAPLDMSLAMPVTELRTFWMTQAEAVANKPFSCDALVDINDGFAKLEPLLQKAVIPPFGDMWGVRIALDSITPDQKSSLPTFSGRLVLGTKNPIGLLAMSQMMVPTLAKLKPATDGTPLPLPDDMADMLEQPAWIAMSDNAIALGVGDGEDARLAADLKAATGNPGQMSRMHVSGAMYLEWLQLMEQKMSSLGSPANGDTDSPAAQLTALKAQMARLDSIDVEMHVENDGMVITSQTRLKPTGK